MNIQDYLPLLQPLLVVLMASFLLAVLAFIVFKAILMFFVVVKFLFIFFLAGILIYLLGAALLNNEVSRPIVYPIYDTVKNNLYLFLDKILTGFENFSDEFSRNNIDDSNYDYRLRNNNGNFAGFANSELFIEKPTHNWLGMAETFKEDEKIHTDDITDNDKVFANKDDNKERDDFFASLGKTTIDFNNLNPCPEKLKGYIGHEFFSSYDYGSIFKNRYETINRKLISELINQHRIAGYSKINYEGCEYVYKDNLRYVTIESDEKISPKYYKIGFQADWVRVNTFNVSSR
jgi:hypothetical protein